MSLIEIPKFEWPKQTTVSVPGSKSYTNRALILAALTKGPVTLHNPLYCEDTEAMIGCLRTLGLHIETSRDQVIIFDDISLVKNNSYELFTYDSGTTLRFLLPLVCLVPGTKIISGSQRLNERPIQDLVEALRGLGAEINYLEKTGQPPLSIRSSVLSAGEVVIRSSLSSQFLSALLMIAPLLNGLKIRHEDELISKPYIDMTVSIMKEWGLDVRKSIKNEYVVLPEKRDQKNRYTIEGDFSSAGYYFAIGALTQSTITVKNLNPYSVQADRNFLKILEKMGNTIFLGDQEISIKGNTILPMAINMEDCPDQVQTMAVLAAFAQGTTTISGVRSLRWKETERIYALKNELHKMGIHAEDTHDTLTIYGGNPQPATIDTYGDHRMAMSFALAGTRLTGMKIKNPEVVNKTFPDFWHKLRSL